ncbi:MAG: glycosyltransferase family 4 protein [Candidatus Dormibacteraeota bacterium]|nr:glycosyltransferase family 4 protein [Candidatus Dormibacteraeota bacterium]
MLASETAHQFFLLWDSSRRPAALDDWATGRAVSLPIASAPEVAWEQLRLPLALRRHRIDVVHRPSGAGGLALRPLAGSRVVVTVHDVIPLRYPGQYLRSSAHRAFFAFQMSLSRRAAAVITVSETSKRDLVEIGRFSPSKIAVIGEGVDRDFLTSSPAELPSIDNGPYLLAMGAGEPRKNVARVIEGFLRVADRIPHRLLLVGAPWRGRRASLPPAGIDRIEDLGAVTNAQLRALYRGAAAFIYPSLYEGFGLPVLEAMASGTPVITSRAGSLEEIAGSAALYVDPQDASAIGDAIQQVVTDPLRRSTLVAAGQARVRLFSWEAAARQTIEVYERAAAAG